MCYSSTARPRAPMLAASGHSRDVQHCPRAVDQQAGYFGEEGGARLTVVAANECVAVLVRLVSVDVLFCLFESNVHVPVEATQDSCAMRSGHELRHEDQEEDSGGGAHLGSRRRC